MPIEKSKKGELWRTGQDMVGRRVRMWERRSGAGRGGRSYYFSAVGTVIEFKQMRKHGDKLGRNYLVSFPPTPKQKASGMKSFDMWCMRSSLEDVTDVKDEARLRVRYIGKIKVGTFDAERFRLMPPMGDHATDAYEQSLNAGSDE